MNRKGALELSVTGVVVLIIAIVVLGSVIFFIRSFFGETQGLIGQQLASVKEQLRKTIDETGEPVAMDFGRELKLKKGQPQVIYVGMRNDFANTKTGKQDVCYALQFVCLRAFSGGQGCNLPGVTATGPTIVGGYGHPDSTYTITGSTVPTSPRAWMTKLLTVWDLPNRGTDVNPVTFQISDADPDTYQMELRVYVANQYNDCSDALLTSGGFQAAPWQTKRFLIELT